MVVKYLHYDTNTSHRFEIDVICWAQVVIFLKRRNTSNAFFVCVLLTLSTFYCITYVARDACFQK